ncbi:MAG: tRNA (adenosine(37)-N6)-dimethylallyltransferase MiaA [Bauldia sp.]|nr:tRNA (adenosine(37)-N6)-dimethylallyltransferase MiaA [Bauldia sp.]
MTDAILIAGPTASGKSRLAIDIARREGGVVINADSMQVYGELRVLSARPDEVDLAAVPHDLYGHVPATTRYSVGHWLSDAAAALDRARGDGRLPIFVGGTGLYFRALTEGLASIPPVPAAVRQRLADETRDLPSEDLHARLAATDPETAGEVRPSDRARICRALEVLEATGRPLAAWRKGPGAPPLVGADVRRMVIAPDRAWLHHRISMRADAMLHDGVLDEVRRLLGLGLSPELPAMKAIGVRHFQDHLEGDLSLDEAIVGVKTETRRYAKRQETWFRNQMPDWPRVAPPGQ